MQGRTGQNFVRAVSGQGLSLGYWAHASCRLGRAEQGAIDWDGRGGLGVGWREVDMQWCGAGEGASGGRHGLGCYAHLLPQCSASVSTTPAPPTWPYVSPPTAALPPPCPCPLLKYKHIFALAWRQAIDSSHRLWEQATSTMTPTRNGPGFPPHPLHPTPHPCLPHPSSSSTSSFFLPASLANLLYPSSSSLVAPLSPTLP